MKNWQKNIIELIRDESGQLTASYLLLLIAAIVLGYLVVRTVANIIGGGDLPCPGGGLIDCPDNGTVSIYGNYTELVSKPSYHDGPY